MKKILIKLKVMLIFGVIGFRISLCILLIDLINDFNNRDMIYHKKSTLQRSVK